MHAPVARTARGGSRRRARPRRWCPCSPSGGGGPRRPRVDRAGARLPRRQQPGRRAGPDGGAPAAAARLQRVGRAERDPDRHRRRRGPAPHPDRDDDCRPGRLRRHRGARRGGRRAADAAPQLLPRLLGDAVQRRPAPDQRGAGVRRGAGRDRRRSGRAGAAPARGRSALAGADRPLRCARRLARRSSPAAVPRRRARRTRAPPGCGARAAVLRRAVRSPPPSEPSSCWSASSRSAAPGRCRCCGAATALRWGLRELGLLVLVGTTLARPRLPRSAAGWAPLVAGAALACVGTALLGHSGTGWSPQPTRVLAAAAHLGAAATWSGCLVVLAVVLAPHLRRDAAARELGPCGAAAVRPCGHGLRRRDGRDRGVPQQRGGGLGRRRDPHHLRPDAAAEGRPRGCRRCARPGEHRAAPSREPARHASPHRPGRGGRRRRRARPRRGPHQRTAGDGAPARAERHPGHGRPRGPQGGRPAGERCRSAPTGRGPTSSWSTCSTRAARRPRRCAGWSCR